MSFSSQLIKDLTPSGEKGMPILEIVRMSGASEGYVRNQLRAMESAGTIERVDNRVPIYYRINPKSPAMRHKEAVDNAKKTLLAPIADNEHPMLKIIKKQNKGTWASFIQTFEVLAEAIRQLDEDNKLVDTL